MIIIFLKKGEAAGTTAALCAQRRTVKSVGGSYLLLLPDDCQNFIGDHTVAERHFQKTGRHEAESPARATGDGSAQLG